MPPRLVYSPKAYVFTKHPSGEILNFTPYVTGGRVQRLVDQASTAQVSMRNPQKRFTIPTSPTFHPMDPITIFLERIQGFPVQVFTGYLDDTPYYQMYPGVITINATCTLKRLMYTYWDPSLPYINAFLQKYGWINNNGALTNVPALGNTGTVAQGKAGALQDGSIGKLLWAILTDVGDWNDTNIWIENLPSGDNGIANRMAMLMAQLATDEQNAATEFNTFMESIVGSSSFGSGGGAGGAAANGLTNGGNLTVEGQPISQQQLDVVNIALGEGVTLGSPKNGMIACIYAGMGESGLGSNPGTFAGTGGAQGVWQAQPGDYNNGRDTQAMANAFYTGGKDFRASGAIVCANRGDPPWMIANEVEANQVWNNTRGDSYANRWPGGQAQGIAEATAIVNAYLAHNGPLGTNTPGTTPSAVNGVGAPIASSVSPTTANPLTTQAGSAPGTSTTGAAGGQTTVINAMISAAATIANKDYPYAFGGGHPQAGTPSQGPATESGGPSVLGYDCSGSVAAVLSAAGLWTQGSSVPRDDGIISQLLSQNIIAPGPGSGTPECTLYDNPSVHIFMRLDGKFWGTSDGQNGNHSQPNGGAGWLNDSHPDASSSSFNQYHILPSILSRATTYQGPTGSGTAPPATGASATGTSTSSILSQSSAEAFTAEINFPSIADMTTAMILGSAHKGLMHDQQLLPFIQQLSQASMRSFQSLPNGDFFAFYPDYFGETNHRKPYWEIRDIEILDGGIRLNDQSLVTHEYAVGDNTYPVNNELINMLFSAGTITVFNAFMDPSAVSIDSKKQLKGGMADVMSQTEAIDFIKRYGARPQVQDFPMVRSPLYEMFLAYQNFLLAWSNQFSTPFQFTFMPEVFPGGKVAFPDHGIQMYVQSVTHSWDYAESGFTTDAVLSAPAAMAGDWPDLPDNMVQALVEPVRMAAQSQGSKQGNAQTTATQVSGTGKAIEQVNKSKVQQILGSL